MYGFVKWNFFTSLFAKIPDDVLVLIGVLHVTVGHICAVAQIFILRPVHKCY